MNERDVINFMKEMATYRNQQKRGRMEQKVEDECDCAGCRFQGLIDDFVDNGISENDKTLKDVQLSIADYKNDKEYLKGYLNFVKDELSGVTQEFKYHTAKYMATRLLIKELAKEVNKQ